MTEPRERLAPWITAAGAWSPLGRGPLQVAMCARAGKLEPRPTPFTDLRGRKIEVARVLGIPDEVQGWERLVALAAPVLRDAARGIGRPAPLFLAVSSPGGPDDDDRFGPPLIAALARRSRAPIDLQRAEVIRRGPVGFAVALERAASALSDPDTPAALVGAVDSRYHEALLADLDRAGRLSTLERRADLIPAEAAGFLLLERPSADHAAPSRPPLAALSALAIDLDGSPDRLTTPAEEILRRTPCLPWVLTDQYDRAFAAAPEDRPPNDRGIEDLGDLGAAAGALLTTLVCTFFRVRCAPAAPALIALHGDGPASAAILLDDASPTTALAPSASFHASTGAPSLHDPGVWADPLDADAEHQHLRLARDCMEEIAIVGDLLRGDHDRWISAAPFEQRLLDNLDALAVLLTHPDRAVVDLQRRAAELSLPERGRALALGLALGCMAGDDPARAIVLAVRKARPGALVSWERALARASGPAVADAMRRLLHSERPELVRLALEVLRAHRAAALDPIAPLLGDPDPRVRIAAARCAVVTGARADVLPLLHQKLDDPDDAVALAAAEGLLLLDDAAGLSWVRTWIRDASGAPHLAEALRARVVRLLALAGGATDLSVLLDAAAADPALAIAVGWHGHPAAIGPLLDLLERIQEAIGRGEPVRGAELGPARALHRITGAGLRKHAIADAAGPRPITDVHAWRALAEERRGRYADGARLRFGVPFTVAATLDELRRNSTHASVRPDLALEAAIFLGPAVRIEVNDWCARQRAAIATARQALAARAEAPCAPGGWPDERLGQRWEDRSGG